MPSELRILRFKLDEVGESLRALGPRIGVIVPDGEFISAAPAVVPEEEAPNTSFAVNGSDESLTITNGKLAASLIHYCNEMGISLPREGKKEIYVSSQFVELRIGLRHARASDDAGNAVKTQA